MYQCTTETNYQAKCCDSMMAVKEVFGDPEKAVKIDQFCIISTQNRKGDLKDLPNPVNAST